MPLKQPFPSTHGRAVRPVVEGPSVAELVAAAQAGDERAWTDLVRRFEPMMRHVARRYGLSPAQVDDVLQAAWLRLFEHIGDLRAAHAAGAWLRVTVRREAFRVLQGHVRERLMDEPPGAHAAEEEGPEAQVIHSERRAVLSRAIATLPERHRLLMEVMLSEPHLPYHHISVRTGIPQGSIGPIRGRCLVRIANRPDVQALRE